MSPADSLHANLSKVRYTNYYPSDVVVQEPGSFSILNPGISGDSAGNHVQEIKTVSDTTPNMYGKRCLVRYIWNIDNGGWNAAEDVLLTSASWTVPGPSTTSLPLAKALVEVRCSDTTITAITGNGDQTGGTVSNTGVWSGGAAIAHTFNIKYALIALDE